MIRIVVADDHPLFREGVTRSLREAGLFDILGEASSGRAALALVREHRPDMALLDISMPDGGVETAAEITAAFPDLKVVMLTVSEGGEDIVAAIKAGAAGYVLKGVGSSELTGILTGIMAGESYVTPWLAALLWTELRQRQATTADTSQADLLATLTQREDEILRLVARGMSNKLVARGMSNKLVARELDIQEKTVKHHMTSILGKLRVRNRTEAAVLLQGAEANKN